MGKTCSKCGRSLPSKIEQYSYEYQNYKAYYRYGNYNAMHRVCPLCLKEMVDKFPKEVLEWIKEKRK